MTLRRLGRFLNYLGMVGFLGLALLPLILFLRIQPWMLTIALAAPGIGCLLFRRRARSSHIPRLTKATVVLVGVAAVMLVVELTGVLDPAVDPEVALSFDVNAHVTPTLVSRGDTITYRATVKNTGGRKAAGRTFEIAGQRHTGYMLYVHLPIWNAQSLEVTSVEGRIIGSDAPVTIVFCDPGLSALNPSFWQWVHSQQPHHRIIGVITGDGSKPTTLPSNATLELTYQVLVPEDYTKDSLATGSAGISYTDPAWRAYRPYDTWTTSLERVIVRNE